MGYESRPEQPPLRMFGGLNTRDSELGLPGNDSPYMLNVDLHPRGSIKSRSGSLSLSTPSGETQVEAVMRLEQPEQTRGWVYIYAGGTIYRVPEPGTWTWQSPTHKAGGSPTYTALPDQQSYGRANSRYYDAVGAVEHPSVLYLPFSDRAPMIALGQTSATDDLISLPAGAVESAPSAGDWVKGYPASWAAGNWPTHMRLISLGHGSRMYAWGFAANPNMIAYSELNVPYNFMYYNMLSGAAAQPLLDGGDALISGGDGDKIVAVADMFSYKVIFKRRKTLIYTGDPGNTYDDNFPWQLQTEFPVGCVSDRAWVKVGNDIMFWAEDGPRTLSAVQEYGDLAQSNLAFKINDQVRGVAPGHHERIRCYHDITNMRVIWYYPSPGATANNAAYVHYYNDGEWSKWSGPSTEMVDVEVVRTTAEQYDRVIGGSAENGVVQLEAGLVDADIDDDDVDIAAEYYTNWINMGEVSDATRSLVLDVIFGDGGTGVNIYYQTDLNTDWTQVERLERSIGGGGTRWGSFAWGSAPWGATSRAIQRYEFGSLFNIVRLKFSKTGSTGFEIMGFRIEARMKGLRT